MHRLQELVRLYRMQTGVRERARMLGMSTRTERRYRLAIEARGLLEGDRADLPSESDLRAAVESVIPTPVPRPVKTSVDRWLPVIGKAVAKGVGPQAIWDKLHREEPEFTASVSAVKRAARRLRREQGVRPVDVVIAVETAPGEIAQVDFGFAGRFFDPVTGLVRKVWLFVMVLCYSRHMFAKLVFDQKATTWVALHVEAFQWFGGVPGTVVPDNLQAAVTRAAFGASDRHNLALNRTYRELARYFGFKIDPAPVRSPKKKGKVESTIKYARRSYLLPGDFETVDVANAGLPDWLLKTAGMRIHGTTGRRPLDLFAVERTALRPLPTIPYDPVVWKSASVHADAHVEFDRRLYSVPWPHIGSQVWVKATAASVLIYASDQRIATHARRGADRRSTVPSHLPVERADLAQRSIDFWIARADRLDPVVGQYARNVVASDDVLSKLRDVQAIVTLLERFPRRRARCACERADFFGNYTYQGVRRILDEALDLVPLPNHEPHLHGSLAQPRFARTPSELVACPKEVSHEPHR